MAKNPNCPKLPWLIDFHMGEDGVLRKQYTAAFAKTQLEHDKNLHTKSPPSTFRATRLISSIPPSATVKSIEELLSGGVNVAKIVSCDASNVGNIIKKVRQAVNNFSKKIGMLYSVGIALEIKGPVIQTGKLKPPQKQLHLKEGQTVRLTTDKSYEEVTDKEILFVDYEHLPQVVQPGDTISLDYGAVTLSAIEIVHSIIKCIVDKAGTILNKSTVMIPSVPLQLPEITDSDKKIIKISTTECVDFFWLSSIQHKDAIEEIKNLIDPDCKTMQLVTEIDSAVAIERVDDLIENSDGICINCLKLIAQIPREKVFIATKSIIARCKLAGKPVMTTIQINGGKELLTSEYTDLATAIMDGVDGFCLSITSSTKAIINAINKVCKEAESAVYQKRLSNELVQLLPLPMEATYSLAISAVDLSLKCNASAIICVTTSGRSVKMLSRFQPKCVIIAVTKYARVARMLGIFKSVKPLVYLRPSDKDWLTGMEQKLQFGITFGKVAGHIQMGSVLITVTPSRSECGLGNTIKVIYASELMTSSKKFVI